MTKYLLFFLLICPSITNAKSLTNNEIEKKNLATVIHFYDQFFNQHETKNSTKFIANQYIQHNPEVPDGKMPFVNYFTSYFKENPEYRSKIVRSATNGDLVWLHVHSTNNKKDSGQAVVDIFRLKNGYIVEHWDVIQNVPKTAANKNTMF